MREKGKVIFKSRIITFIYALTVILIIWSLVNKFGDEYIRDVLVSPRIVGNTIWEMILSGELKLHIISSLYRVALGCSIAASIGISLGMLMGLNKKFNKFLDPFIQIARPIAPIAWIPLAILFLGIGLWTVVFLCFLGPFFATVLNTISGVQNVDENLIKAARVFGANKRRIVFEVVMPSAIPQIVVGIRIGIGSSFMTMVAAEMLGALSGLGYLIGYGRGIARPDIIIAGMVVIGITGYFIDVLTRSVENYAQRYKSI
jgi:ABC-type nitrate/sulfonate/bicarbonate transport system permease component